MLSEEETSFNQLNRDANYVHENFNLVDSYFHVRTLCHDLVTQADGVSKSEMYWLFRHAIALDGKLPR